jgi:hypothetical protein
MHKPTRFISIVVRLTKLLNITMARKFEVILGQTLKNSV